MKYTLVILALALFFRPSVARSQYWNELDRGTSIVYGTAGVFTSKVSQGVRQMNGLALQGGYERLLSESWSVGIVVGYASADQDLSNSINQRELSYSAVPVLAVARYYVGRTNPVGYLGFGLGAQIGSLETNVNGTRTDESATEFAFAIPMGFIWFVDHVGVTANYTGTIVPDPVLIDDISHFFNFGAAYRF
jgi:hypothetical protein